MLETIIVKDNEWLKEVCVRHFNHSGWSGGLVREQRSEVDKNENIFQHSQSNPLSIINKAEKAFWEFASSHEQLKRISENHRTNNALKQMWMPPLRAPAAVRSAKMYTFRRKIQKDKDAEPSEFEESVAQALFDLETSNQELKSDLKDLYINSAVQIDVSGNRKAVVVHVPYRLRKAFRKIHVRLVRELEKKFSGKEVIVIATRRILRPPKKGSAVQRPRSRTLTAVHDAMLEDVVYPAEIVGKRVRYRLDGSKIIKIYLDPKERNNTEYKLETFAGVYRKLSGKDVVFEFPITEA
ncbi:hypothetical protein NE237_021925 [Protea cynaroides]|uniref:40S ribosomal protein S7 n=1 Tax=Protea cynaroides TaxID=273540 RepID=A0A9Q0K4U2_9MAGN|nr:hypothetical protein NE237_021925 [Protea cynaroides]